MRQRTKNDLQEFSQLAEAVAYNANGAMPAKSVGVTPKRKKSKAPKPDPRGFRWQVRAWLDANKPDQLDLGRWIHDLKCKRTFAPILRNALSLYRELMEGQTAMLYELFPKLNPPTPKPDAENEELKKRVAVLEGQVKILEQVIVGLKLPTEIDNAVKMAAPVHTPRAQVYKPSPVTAPQPVVEVDTSSAFLDAF